MTSWPWLNSDTSAYNLSKQIEGLDVDTINVGINSYGGEVAEGLAIYNALKRHKAKVVTRCDGFACSIASVIFAAGDERVMSDASLLMIHNAWTYASGDAKALRKQADDIEKVNEASITAYMAVADIEEEKLRALMDEETWISPEEAVEIGLATSVETTESDKPSQSVRGKVMQMLLRNPYQLEEDPEDPETSDDAATETDGETEEPEVPETEDTEDPDGTEPDPDSTNPDEPDPDDEEEQQSRMVQFLTAISRM